MLYIYIYIQLYTGSINTYIDSTGETEYIIGRNTQNQGNISMFCSGLSWSLWGCLEGDSPLTVATDLNFFPYLKLLISTVSYSKVKKMVLGGHVELLVLFKFCKNALTLDKLKRLLMFSWKNTHVCFHGSMLHRQWSATAFKLSWYPKL